MINQLSLEVKKIGRSWCVVADVSVLGKFRTEEKAAASMIEDFEMYKYWAGSAGVCIQNTPPVVVAL